MFCSALAGLDGFFFATGVKDFWFLLQSSIHHGRFGPTRPFVCLLNWRCLRWIQFSRAGIVSRGIHAFLKGGCTVSDDCLVVGCGSAGGLRAGEVEPVWDQKS